MNRGQQLLTAVVLTVTLVGVGSPVASASAVPSASAVATALPASAQGPAAGIPAPVADVRGAAPADATAARAGAASAAAKAALALIKKHGGSVLSAAKSAAKKGVPAFRKWFTGLAWYHPVRIALTALSGEAILWVVQQLV